SLSLPMFVGCALEVCQQLYERCPWLPANWRIANGRQIEIKQPHQNIPDDSSSDWSELIAAFADICLPQDVIPKRRFPRPTGLNRADFLPGQWFFIQKARDGFARRKPGALSSFKVADSKRMELLDFDVACKCDWKRDEGAHQTAVNLLRACSCRPPG